MMMAASAKQLLLLMTRRRPHYFHDRLLYKIRSIGPQARQGLEGIGNQKEYTLLCVEVEVKTFVL
jgi:hypothetical protein